MTMILERISHRAPSAVIKKTNRVSQLLLLPVFVIGCATLNKVGPSSFDPGSASDWPSPYQEIAKYAWLYAQMAENAYQRSVQFVLPDTVKIVRSVHELDTGFGASVYELRSSIAVDSVTGVVIAFRGTDGPDKVDWRFGNIEWAQNDRAEAFYGEVRRAYPGGRISVTGHSLGGALSLQVSTRNDSVETYVFNSSYHIRNSLDKASERWSIAEARDVLMPVRVIQKNPTITHHPYFNCQGGGSSVDRHSMTMLAWCVTRIAAFKDPGAAESIRRNSRIGAIAEGSNQIDRAPLSPDSLLKSLSPVPLRPAGNR